MISILGRTVHRSEISKKKVCLHAINLTFIEAERYNIKIIWLFKHRTQHIVKSSGWKKLSPKSMREIVNVC